MVVFGLGDDEISWRDEVRAIEEWEVLLLQEILRHDFKMGVGLSTVPVCCRCMCAQVGCDR